MTTITIPAKDGYPLAATLWDGDAEKPFVVINPATAVPRGYYNSFAEFLSGQGLGVVIYDYRGIGDSAPRSGLRGFQASMTEWAIKDVQAVLDWAHARYPARPLSVIGHSFGGQCLGMTLGNDRFHRVLMVGVQSGYWGNFSFKAQLALVPLWYLVMPIVVSWFGYFPARRFGLGENLPAGVALEWAQWCRQPEYYYGAFMRGQPNRFHEIRAPIRVHIITDDGYGPEKAVRAMMTYLPSERVETVKLSPKDLGRGSIGHFGFFRTKYKDALWADAARFLAGKS